MRLDQVLIQGTFAARPAVGALPNGTLYAATDTQVIYQIVAGAWTTYISAGSATPGGADKTIQYNNAAAFGGVTINATATKKYLQQVSSGVPSLQQVSGADLVDASVGPTQLEATAVTPGTYGDATHVSEITIDADGRITAAVETVITPPAAGAGGADKNIQYNNATVLDGVTNNATATKKYLQQVSSGVPSLQQVSGADLVDASVGPTQLEATAVAAGTYGDATHAPQITVDADGRIIDASENAMNGEGAGGALTLKETILVTTNSQTVTFSTLAGNTDKNYLLLGKMKNNAGANVDYTLRPNGLTTNQAGRVAISSATPTGYSDWRICSAIPDGQFVQFRSEISAQCNPDSIAFPRSQVHKYTNVTTAPALGDGEGASVWSDTSTELTSLEVRASAANGIGEGSQFMLYIYGS